MSDELPLGWATALVGDVAEVRLGRQRSPDRHSGPNMRKYVRAANVTWDGFRVDDVNEMDFTPSEFEIFRLREGDILLGEASGSAAEVGKSAIWTGEVPECCFQNTLIRVRAPIALVPYLHHHFVHDARSGRFAKASRGIGIHHLGREAIQEWEVNLPPLPEQRRIVDKLDDLRARSRKAREALREVPALLDKLKQSVLASAFRGDLTAEWRAAHPDVEPASVLLDRIRAERRKRWEEANPRKKYVEPEPVDADGLPELPEGWCWSTLGEAFEVFVGATPSRQEPSFWGGTVPWVSSGEVAFCRIKATRECITERGLRHTSTSVHPPGTVLIGMIGEGRTRGQVAILDIAACNNQNSAAIRVDRSGVRPEFLYRYMESQYERSRSLGSGNNQPALNKSRVQAMFVPLAPLAEQREVVAVLEDTFSAWSGLSATRASAASMIDSLDQSILAKAFRGELVPQDPNDEPAEVLLARIKAEAGDAQPTRGRGRPPNKASR